MSLFNKSSANTTSSNTTQDQTTSNVDNRVGGDNAAFGGNVSIGPTGNIDKGGITISTTDQGAIKAGSDAIMEAIQSVTDLAKNQTTATQSVAKDSISQAYGLANQARQSETSGAINNFLQYGTWIALAGILAYAVINGKK